MSYLKDKQQHLLLAFEDSNSLMEKKEEPPQTHECVWYDKLCIGEN